MNPIIGIRYKSAVTENFDFCENCEACKDHSGPFFKIRTPNKAPVSGMVVLEEPA